MAANLITRKGRLVQDPPFARRLLSNTWAALLWLPVRIWLGLQWIESGLGKLDNPAWSRTGEALQGFWQRAIAVPETGRPPIAFDSYRSFIETLLNAQAYTWFAKLVVAGELLVGIALLLGAFTGIAAFFGAFMNWNFMMAGSASTNPVLFLAAIGLILAWKVAGYLGADYFLLRWLGTPWKGEKVDSRPERIGRPHSSPELAGSGD